MPGFSLAMSSSSCSKTIRGQLPKMKRIICYAFEMATADGTMRVAHPISCSLLKCVVDDVLHLGQPITDREQVLVELEARIMDG